jgi:hypothetical protein
MDKRRPKKTYSRRPRGRDKAAAAVDALKSGGFVFGKFDPEHDSVEPVQNPDSSDGEYQEQAFPIEPQASRPRRSQRRRHRMEEVVDADEHLKEPQRRRLTSSAEAEWVDDDKGKEELDDDDLDDDDHDLDQRAASGNAAVRTEQATLDDVEKALRINNALLATYREQAAYYRSRNLVDDPDLKRVEQAMSHTLTILTDWGLPVRQVGPVEHAIPPHIPMADGSEMRFTNVANSMGIKWSLVSEDDKFAVYERAADLHAQIYGARPIQVNMWTSDGYRPVAYYDAAHYKPTMVRALREYHNGMLPKK